MDVKLNLQANWTYSLFIMDIALLDNGLFHLKEEIL